MPMPLQPLLEICTVFRFYQVFLSILLLKNSVFSIWILLAMSIIVILINSCMALYSSLCQFVNKVIMIMIIMIIIIILIMKTL